MVRNLLKAYRMDRTAIRVTDVAHADAERRAAHRAMSPQQRLEMLEYLRQLNYGYDACAGRLQRVLEVSERQ